MVKPSHAMAEDLSYLFLVTFMNSKQPLEPHAGEPRHAPLIAFAPDGGGIAAAVVLPLP